MHQMTISTIRRLITVQDDILIQSTILCHTFALPQFMAQHSCEDLKPTKTPNTVPAAFQSSSDHTFNPGCAHNPMDIQCNQFQYPTFNQYFAKPQFRAQHNCEYQEPTNNPSAVPTALQVPSDHTINPMCAHNLMTTQFNKSHHQGPPKAPDPNLKRYKYNALVEWETGENTY